MSTWRAVRYVYGMSHTTFMFAMCQRGRHILLSVTLRPQMEPQEAGERHSVPRSVPWSQEASRHETCTAKLFVDEETPTFHDTTEKETGTKVWEENKENTVSQKPGTWEPVTGTAGSYCCSVLEQGPCSPRPHTVSF